MILSIRITLLSIFLVRSPVYCLERDDDWWRNSDVFAISPSVWTPSDVKIGDVGYHRRPQGSFVRLFNAFDPVGSATSHGEQLPPLTGVQTGYQSAEQRGMLRRGFDWVGGFLRTPKPKSPSSTDNNNGSTSEREVSRKYDFILRSGHKRAMIVAESTVYVSVSFMDHLCLPKWMGGITSLSNRVI